MIPALPVTSLIGVRVSWDPNSGGGFAAPRPPKETDPRGTVRAVLPDGVLIVERADRLLIVINPAYVDITVEAPP